MRTDGVAEATAEIPEVTEKKASSTGRSTAVFAVWTAVSRVAGLAREIIAARMFGVKGAINAFVIAFQIPNLLRSLVADSALSAAFVPMFARLREEGKEEEARRLAGALLGLITMVLGGLTLIAIVTAPWVMPFFGWNLPADQIDNLVGLSQVMFPIVLLLGLTGLVMGILQSYGEFTTSAFAPVLWNIVILVGLIGVTPFLHGDRRIYGYAVGILVGTVVQLLYLLPGLRGKGPFPLSLGFSNRHVRMVLIMMLPVTIGLGLINVNAVVDTFIAQRVSEESVRAIDAAFRLYILPQGIFSVAVSTVLFPALSRMAAREDHEGMGDVITTGTRQIFFLLVPSSVFLAVLATPVTRLVFERGEFDAAATDLTAGALFYFAFGLVFNGASLLLIRAFFSLQEPWTPTRIAGAAVAFNAILDLILIIPFGTGGIPLATSIASFLTFFALLLLLRREIGGIDLRSIADGFARTLFASVFFGAWAFGLWHAIDGALGRSLPAQLLSVGAATVLAPLAYLGVCRGLRMREIDMLVQLKRKLR